MLSFMTSPKILPGITTKNWEGKVYFSLFPEKEDEYLNKFVDIELAIHAHKAPLLTRQKDKNKINQIKQKNSNIKNNLPKTNISNYK